MGLDMYIDARRNIKTPQEERKEIVYWRKFWDLQNHIVEITDAKVDKDLGIVIISTLDKSYEIPLPSIFGTDSYHGEQEASHQDSLPR